MSEIWKDILGFESYYQASSLGRIRSLDRDVCVIYKKKSKTTRAYKGTILKVDKDICSSGYYMVTLCTGRRRYRRLVHRLVASAFLGPQEDMEVNHIDQNKLNNSVSNLEWTTRSGNILHSVHLGNHRTVKLSPDLIIKIRKALANRASIKSIASLLGVGRRTIWNIKSGRTWRTI